MSQLLSDFTEAAAKKYFILDVSVRTDGRIIDRWGRFEAAPRFETYSVAKTVTGIAAGMAIDDGRLSLDEKIMPLLCPKAEYNDFGYAEEITVKDLLTMSSGIDNTMLWRDGHERRHERDWISYIFRNGKFVNRPGTVFTYNNANSYMLSCLIEKKYGMNMREFLRNRLFEPLGIGNVEWLSCPMGHTIAANGLSLNAEELGSLGQLIANKGHFGKKQLVSEQYIKQMLTVNTLTGEYIPADPPEPAGYGYQIWLDGIHNAAFMWGTFGQYCIVVPEKNAVVSVISLEKQDGGSNGDYSTSPLRKLIWETLVETL